MKALNSSEIEVLVQDLKNLVGARLQEVQGDGAELGLSLYLDGISTWLWFDFSPARPLVIRLAAAPKKLQKKLPVSFFLNAHGKGLRLSDVSTEPPGQRIVRFVFGHGEDPLLLEARLFPHGANLLVEKGNKKISLLKVQNLKNAVDAPQNLAVRSMEEIRRQWVESKSPNQTGDPIKKKQKLLEKNVRA